MPKKKKSMPSKCEKVLPADERGSLEIIKQDDIPDKETLQKMKEELCEKQPELRQMFQMMENTCKKGIEQAQDSSVVFTNRRGKVFT